MTRQSATTSPRIVRWIPRGFLLGSVIVGGTVLSAEPTFADGGFPFLFRKPATAEAGSEGAVLEIRKLLAEAHVAAQGKDFSTAVRLAERAQKLALTNSTAVASAPDCAPAQITTTLQQYRLARAGKDVRLSLEPSRKPANPQSPGLKSAPASTPPAAGVPASRPTSATGKTNSTAVPIEKMLARNSSPQAPIRKATASLPSASVLKPPAVAEPPATAATTPVRSEQKVITDFRPSTVVSRTSAAVIQIRKEFESPLTSWDPTISGPVVRSSEPSPPAWTASPEAKRVVEIGREAMEDAKPAVVKLAANLPKEVASPEPPRTSGIDPALTERLLKPLAGLQVQFQDAPSIPMPDSDSSEAIVAAEAPEVPMENTFSSAEPEVVTAQMTEEEPQSEDLPVETPELEAAVMATAFVEETVAQAAPESREHREFLQTLPPVYEVRTVEVVQESPVSTEPADAPAEQPKSVETAPPVDRTPVVRHLEWSPVVEPVVEPMKSLNALTEPAIATADAEMLSTDSAASETADEVEQVGYLERGEYRDDNSRVSPHHRPVLDVETGPFVVFREQPATVRPEWNAAPAPPVESSASVLRPVGQKGGLPRDALWWFSAAGILMGALGLSSLLPRRD